MKKRTHQHSDGTQASRAKPPAKPHSRSHSSKRAAHTSSRSKTGHGRNQRTQGAHRGTDRNTSLTPTFTAPIFINGKGIGFVNHPDSDERIEIPTDSLNTALHKDTVTVTLRARRFNRPLTGEVCEIVSRAKTSFVGTLVQDDGVWYLDPDDRHMYVNVAIHKDDVKKAKQNMKALVSFSHWSDPRKLPEGRIVEIIGKKGEHETEIRSVVLAAGFDYTFPAAVEREAELIHKSNEQLLQSELKRRRDMRDTTTFTIDPDDAKDFDDAISVQALSDGKIEIGIHIADVSAYVKPNDPIDREAAERGTSIYLVDRTIPMLPEVLSNDACSLNPHEDKLAMSAVFTFDKNSKLIDEWFGETVIRSDTRFTYEEAQKVIESEEGTHAAEMILARDIARKERAERFKQGAIAFETDEIKFVLDEAFVPIKVLKKQRQEANLMIEDLMLLANKRVALRVSNECKKRAGEPCTFVYRVHDKPKPEKITELATFVEALGFDLPHKDGAVSAGTLNALFKQIEGTPLQDMIETAAIRSMAKAIYSLKNIGHFGLAFTHYCHFTSPIRRYPDLMVHRILKQVIAGKGTPSREYALFERLATQSTEREIAAAEAERESVKFKQVEYMASRIGEEFDGIISGVTDWGVFVSEVETKAEGMIRLRDLSDYYTLAEHGYKLVGERSGRTIGLADKVRVKLVSVDLEHKLIDWKLIG